jgi:hypothetical protein
MAVNMITRTVGDYSQSAVRLGELMAIGIIQTSPEGEIVPGRVMIDFEERLRALEEAP